MMRERVYLAGPMTGLTVTEAGEWRYRASRFLYHINIEPLDPCRQVTNHGVMSAQGCGSDPLQTAKGLTACDRMDIRRSEAVLVNFLGAKQVSVGTVIELGWADAWRIPIFLVMEPTGNPHEHAMVREIASFHFTTLEDALCALALQFNRRGDYRPCLTD